MPKKETLIIILLCFISRLPQLLSPDLMLDGDECVVAVMAKHLYEGRELPLYFYGQSYGFSFIEVLFIDLHYLLFGISDISVKLAMLLMWTIGILLFYKTLLLLNLKNNYIPFCITLIFICAPAWAVWSMKARGGYLTAFLISYLITYLIFNERISKKAGFWLLSGVLLVVLFESHALWIPGILPIVVYGLYVTGKKPNILYLLTGMIVSAAAFFLIKSSLTNVWTPQVLDLESGFLHPLTDLPRRIFINFTGSYYLAWNVDRHWITTVWAACFTVLAFLSLFIFLPYLLKKKPSRLLYVFGLSFVFSMSYILILGDNAARYLLPLSCYFLFLLAIMADELRPAILVKGLTTFFFISGLCSLYTFKDFRYKAHTKENVVHLIDALTSRNIHHVYCGNALLQWQIMFYSKEDVIARFTSYGERYPKNLKKVNDAFRDNKASVAVTGTLPQRSPYWKHYINIDDQFYINENPSDILLFNYGYDLKDKP
jgi:hypothetical protein